MPMFIVLLVIIVFVVVFSVQNAAPVTMSFLLWNFQASLAIVVLLSLISGIAIAAIIYSIVRLKSALRKNHEQPEHVKTQP